MARVLVAGAAGYLGKFLVHKLHADGFWVRALCRKGADVADLQGIADDLFVGDYTKPATLAGVTDDIDVVISSVGASKHHIPPAPEETDYLGNLNILNQALHSGVKKFIFVSYHVIDGMRALKIIRAKEKFIDALKRSGMNYTIVRSNEYFPDLLDYLKMARRGRIFLFGSGHAKINPIYGAGAAEACIEAIDSKSHEIIFGGPEVYTHTQIAEEAFKAVGKPPHIIKVPAGVAKLVMPLLRIFTPARIHAPVEFNLAVMTHDMVVPVRGKKTISEYFKEEAARI